MTATDLTQWVQDHSNITASSSQIPGKFLERFIEIGAGDLELAKTSLEKFIQIRYSQQKGVPEWFAYDSIDSPNVKIFLDKGYILKLGYDDNGCLVVLFRSGTWNPDEVSFACMVKYMNMCYDIFSSDPAVRSNGLVTMVDFQGFEMKHLSHWTMDAAKKLNLVQDSYPVTLRHVNYFNTSTIFNALYEILKLFMKKSTKELIRVHKDSFDSLHAEIPPRLLPSEYNGSGKSLEQLADEWKAEFSGILQNELEMYGVFSWKD